jgi:RHS repeat-associated protein
MGAVALKAGHSKGIEFLTDALGTVRDVVDDTGAVIRSQEYDEHGNLISSSGTGTFAPKTYQGALSVNDDRNDSGLYLMGHRHYAPELGRFISRDPIGFAGGLHLFNGAGASPVTYVDPLGLRQTGCGATIAPPSNRNLRLPGQGGVRPKVVAPPRPGMQRQYDGNGNPIDVPPLNPMTGTSGPQLRPYYPARPAIGEPNASERRGSGVVHPTRPFNPTRPIPERTGRPATATTPPNRDDCWDDFYLCIARIAMIANMGCPDLALYKQCERTRDNCLDAVENGSSFYDLESSNWPKWPGGGPQK